MIRNLKALGLALIAVFVLCSVAASVASAANGQLTSDGPVTLDASEIFGEVNAFTLFNGSIKCPGSTFTGHRYAVTPHELIPSGAETVTLTPDYVESNCVAVEVGVSHKATITMNECDYVVHIGETTGITDTYDTTADIVCPSGHSIVIDIYFSSSNENLKVCEITIGAQSLFLGATIKNDTNGHLDLHGNYSPITASKSGVCGSSSTASGALDVNLTVAGTNEDGEGTLLGVTDS